jgi:hypothetical protein
LIGEELFGASAYMSREPIHVATLAAQDRLKLFFILVIILGVVMATLQTWSPGLAPYMPDKLLMADWSALKW